MILYRPTNLEELRLAYESGMQGFPPRLPGQPIFYPVLTREYAREIAEKWNATSGDRAGYVTSFNIDDEYARKHESHQVGARRHLEFWIPAEELDVFNTHIIPPILVVDAFFGEGYKGCIPSRFGLKGKDATEQFAALVSVLRQSIMDFRLEVAANSEAIFLNYPYWAKNDFARQEIDHNARLQALKEIKATWDAKFPSIRLAEVDFAADSAGT